MFDAWWWLIVTIELSTNNHATVRTMVLLPVCSHCLWTTILIVLIIATLLWTILWSTVSEPWSTLHWCCCSWRTTDWFFITSSAFINHNMNYQPSWTTSWPHLTPSMFTNHQLLLLLLFLDVVVVNLTFYEPLLFHCLLTTCSLTTSQPSIALLLWVCQNASPPATLHRKVEP